MTAPTAIPQLAALDLQLAACAGNEPAGSLLELRHRDALRGRMRQTFMPLHDRKRAGHAIRELARNGDVYMGVAPRTRPAGGTDAVARCWTLHVDADTAEAVAAGLAFTPPAAVVVMSGGGGAHFYWPQREPLGPAQAVRANRRLAHHLGADMASSDAARILRPAGTSNWKTGEPRPVECVRLEIVSYLAAEVVGHLPDPPGRHRRPAAALPRPASATADELQSIPAAFYLPALTGREIGRDGKAQCPVHAGGNERTPSLHIYEAPVGPGSWYCYACQKGGSIIDLGAALYDLEPRGRGYHEIRRRLAADLLPHLQNGVAA